MEVAQSKIAGAGPRKRQNGGSEGGLGERLGEKPKDANEMAGALPVGQTQDGQMQGNKLRHFSWALASILTCEGPVKVREVVLFFLSQLADDA